MIISLVMKDAKGGDFNPGNVKFSYSATAVLELGTVSSSSFGISASKN